MAAVAAAARTATSSSEAGCASGTPAASRASGVAATWLGSAPNQAVRPVVVAGLSSRVSTWPASRAARTLHLGDQLSDSGREVLAQELHRAHVPADHDHTRCVGVDQPGQHIGDLPGVGLPPVLRALLETALRPSAGGRAGDVQFLLLDLVMRVVAVGQYRDQLRAEPVGDHDEVGQQHPGGRDERSQLRQGLTPALSVSGGSGRWAE
jgi:hypothetical protein